MKPNSTMDAAICAICSAECVRAFLAYGTSRSVGQISMRRAIAGVMVAGGVAIGLNNYEERVNARKSNVGHSPWLAPESATLSRPGAPCRAVWLGVGRLVHPPPRARPGRH